MTSKRRIAGLAAAAAAVALWMGVGAGCASGPWTGGDEVVDLRSLSALTNRTSAVPATPNIRVGQLLKVRVYTPRKAEINDLVVRVQDNGCVSLPMLGALAVAGLTIHDAEQRMTQQFEAYLRQPTVSLDFVLDRPEEGSTSPWGQVTVIGSVKKPGPVDIPPTGDLTIGAALRSAGGLEIGAREKDVQIIRRLSEGKARIIHVNLKQVDPVNGHDSGFRLERGDVINVALEIF